jgi:hypothetical protein
MGAPSGAGVSVIDVTPSSSAPAVIAASDVVVGHACAGEPLVCRPATEDGLVALGASAAGSGVSLTWSATPPPGRELDASRRLTFVAGDDPAAPRVAIETDGTAISGDWVFSVEARDEAGVLGRAEMRVSIGNEPPVVAADLPPSFHTYEPVGASFLAAGAVRLTVTDPDGDPLDGREVTSNHAGDGGAPFAIEDRDDEITYAISVPYRTPTDAAFLIGGEGLERSITLTVNDVNGGSVHQTWPIVVGNRPPELVAERPAISVAHRFDQEAQAYTATATLSTWVDADGDPLFGTPTGDPVCANIRVTAGGTAEALCSSPFVGTPALANFIGAREVLARPADPWAIAEAGSTTTVNILNRSPVVTLEPRSAPTTCSDGERCCEFDPELQREICHVGTLYASSTVQLAGFASDPDGDPLEVEITAGDSPVTGGGTCEPSACSFEVTVPGRDTCDLVGYSNGLTISLDDGVASVAKTSSLTATCSP